MLVVSLLVALFFLGSFLWAIKSGQYEDDYTPSVRILFEDELKALLLTLELMLEVPIRTSDDLLL